MNLAQARQALIDRGFDYLDPSRLTFMLNTAKDGFEDTWAWPWLMDAFPSAPTPTQIANLKLILSVKLANTHQELLGLSVQQALQDGTDLSLPGTPSYWWIEGANTLHVWPGDGADVAVRYVADSPPLVADDDEPLIPARYQSLWIDLAVVEAYKDSDNFSGAQLLRADVLARMQDVIGRYETTNRQHSPFMTQRTEWAMNLDD
jgi:hypothetical protein